MSLVTLGYLACCVQVLTAWQLPCHRTAIAAPPSSPHKSGLTSTSAFLRQYSSGVEEHPRYTEMSADMVHRKHYIHGPPDQGEQQASNTTAFCRYSAKSIAFHLISILVETSPFKHRVNIQDGRPTRNSQLSQRPCQVTENEQDAGVRFLHFLVAVDARFSSILLPAIHAASVGRSSTCINSKDCLCQYNVHAVPIDRCGYLRCAG